MQTYYSMKPMALACQKNITSMFSTMNSIISKVKTDLTEHKKQKQKRRLRQVGNFKDASKVGRLQLSVRCDRTRPGEGLAVAGAPPLPGWRGQSRGQGPSGEGGEREEDGKKKSPLLSALGESRIPDWRTGRCQVTSLRCAASAKTGRTTGLCCGCIAN